MGEEHATEAYEKDGLVDEISAAGTTLNTVEPHQPIDDLNRIRDVLAGANIVGLGERSHGTREVFQFKHRLFRYLVEEMDYRLLGIEVGYAAAEDINNYIRDGAGTAEEVLSAPSIPKTYHCEAMTDLLNWARDFNRGREPSDKVRIYGLDLERQGNLLAGVEETIEEAMPEVYDAFRSDIELLRESPSLRQNDAERVKEYIKTLQKVGREFGLEIDQNRTQFIKQTSEREFEAAIHRLHLVSLTGQAFKAHIADDVDEAFRLRDKAMADTALKALEIESESNIAIWAHNAHIKRGRYRFPQYDPDDVTTLGEHLSRANGTNYLPIGFSVARGGCLTIEKGGNFREIDVHEGVGSSLASVFDEAVGEIGLVDFDSLRDDSGAADHWFKAEPARQYIAAEHKPEPVSYVESDPRTEFDAFVFISDGEAARPF